MKIVSLQSQAWWEEPSSGWHRTGKGRGSRWGTGLRGPCRLNWGSLDLLHVTSVLGDSVQSCSFGSISLTPSGLGSGIQNRQLWFPTDPCARLQCVAQLDEPGGSPPGLLPGRPWSCACYWTGKHASVGGPGPSCTEQGCPEQGKAEWPLPGSSPGRGHQLRWEHLRRVPGET